MKRFALTTALLSLLSMLLSAPARATICTIDAVPAATLLLPYFEVSLTRPGKTTLFSINNASDQGVLVDVILWSDLGVPVTTFNVYLTGYDVQTIDLQAILIDGKFPPTASAGQDPSDIISPQGIFSEDINFASCTGRLPLADLPINLLRDVQQELTGRFSSRLGGTAGFPYGDNVARGYVTVDTVNNCTLRGPYDVGYFTSGGTGDVTNQNVLLGDFFYVDPMQGAAQGNTMVHIEASSTNPETSTPGQYTFYGRYVNWTAADNREPLGRQFWVRYLNKPTFGSTDLIVWRDPKVSQSPFRVGSLPGWYPMGQEAVVIFDEEEGLTVPPPNPTAPANPSGFLPFKASAGRVTVGGRDFPVPFEFGWLYLDLSTVNITSGNVPPEDPDSAQSWVMVVDSSGRYSAGFDAFQFESACHPR